jgi:hypothetical protein
MLLGLSDAMPQNENGIIEDASPRKKHFFIFNQDSAVKRGHPPH